MAMEKNGKRQESKGDRMRPDRMADEVAKKALEKKASNETKEKSREGRQGRSDQ